MFEKNVLVEVVVLTPEVVWKNWKWKISKKIHIYTWTEVESKRRRGRPKKRWKDGVQNCLGVRVLTIRETKECLNDRRERGHNDGGNIDVSESGLLAEIIKEKAKKLQKFAKTATKLLKKLQYLKAFLKFYC